MRCSRDNEVQKYPHIDRFCMTMYVFVMKVGWPWRPLIAHANFIIFLRDFIKIIKIHCAMFYVKCNRFYLIVTSMKESPLIYVQSSFRDVLIQACNTA